MEGRGWWWLSCIFRILESLQRFIPKWITEGKTDPNKQASLTNRSEAMSNRCKQAMAIHLTLSQSLLYRQVNKHYVAVTLVDGLFQAGSSKLLLRDSLGILLVLVCVCVYLNFWLLDKPSRKTFIRISCCEATLFAFHILATFQVLLASSCKSLL